MTLYNMASVYLNIPSMLIVMIVIASNVFGFEIQSINNLTTKSPRQFYKLMLQVDDSMLIAVTLYLLLIELVS